MLITSTRWDFNNDRTIGTFSMPGLECFCLEDCDRGLKKTMPLERIQASKVYGKTAIPYGQYEIIINYSNRFKKPLPLLLDVPGFTGIRIHPLNTAIQTDGCIGPGLRRLEHSIYGSRRAMVKVMTILEDCLSSGEKAFILISWSGTPVPPRDGAPVISRPV